MSDEAMRCPSCGKREWREEDASGCYFCDACEFSWVPWVCDEEACALTLAALIERHGVFGLVKALHVAFGALDLKTGAHTLSIRSPMGRIRGALEIVDAAFDHLMTAAPPPTGETSWTQALVHALRRRVEGSSEAGKP